MSLQPGDRVRAVHFAVSKKGTVEPDTGLIRDEAGEVVTIDDNYTVPVGTAGTVDFIDDTGTAFVLWDNGRRLGLLPGLDKWLKIPKEES